MLSAIDSLLHPTRLEGSAEDLRHARLAAGTSVLFAVAEGVNVLVELRDRAALSLIVLGLLSVGGAVAASLWLRLVRGSVTPPALLLTVPILVAVAFVSLHHDRALIGNSPWAIASAMLITDLVGPIAGMVAFGLICADVAVALTLDNLGLAMSQPLFPGDQSLTAFAEVGLVGMLATGALSWVYVVARFAAQRSLKRAHTRAADAQANLTALIENTSDVICSLDSEGRVVVVNSALQERYRSVGRDLKVGDDLAAVTLPSVRDELRDHVRRAAAGERVVVENFYEVDGQKIWMELFYSPIPGEAPGKVRGVTVFGRDITARKASEEKLEELHRRLMSASFQAGAAEFATGILHNVGNTLNSVNVSANLVAEKIANSKVAGLVKAAEMLREHEADLPAFLAGDPRGAKLANYVVGVTDAIAAERDSIQQEVADLTSKIEHIKSIVRLQQDHAKLGGVIENVSVADLVDDALRLHEVSLGRQGIEIERRYERLPPTPLDRHKLLQILVNLLGNARHALMDGGSPHKRLTLSVDRHEDKVRVQVQDNGVGISPENMAKMFRQGFTTKKDGHGFGLHMSLVTARGMGGSLSCDSEGPGKGATFTILVPTTPTSGSRPPV